MFYSPFVSSLLKYLGVVLIVSRNFQPLALSDGPDSLKENLLLTHSATTITGVTYTKLTNQITGK